MCGFQLAFIGIHLPSYLRDIQLPPDSATTALALIGLFNVIGTYATGAWGQRWRKSWILSAIYALRALAIAMFVIVPASAWSVAIFASVMGRCGCPPCRPPTPSWRNSWASDTCPCWEGWCSFPSNRFIHRRVVWRLFV